MHLCSPRSSPKFSVYPYAVCAVAAAVLPAYGGNEPEPAIKVEITRTSFGVPHIVGKNLQSAAYGLAYAYAQDNVCIAADRFMTVSGERSKYLGGDAPSAAGSTVTNLRSDFYYKNVLDQAAIDKAYAKVNATTSDAIAGYVAGYNRFLADAKDADFGDCATASWSKRPLTEADLKRHLLALATNSGSGAFIAGIADAVPPAGMLTASAKSIQSTQFARAKGEVARFV